MKQLFTLVLLGCILLVGCNNDDNLPTEFSIVGTWELAEVGYQFSVDPGEITIPLDWYQFNADSTFTRTREYDAEWTQYGNGTYVIKPPHDDDVNVLFYVTLNYEAGDDMIGNCRGGGYEEGKEYLFISPDNRLRNTWSWCDGPAYVYDKK